jgi:hypothetical protein
MVGFQANPSFLGFLVVRFVWNDNAAPSPFPASQGRRQSCQGSPLHGSEQDLPWEKAPILQFSGG